MPDGPDTDAGCIGRSIEVQRARYGCHRGDRLQISGSSCKLWKLVGGKTVPKNHEGIGWSWVLEDDGETRSQLETRVARECQLLSELVLTQCPTQMPDRGQSRVTVACVDGYYGYVIDGALDDAYLSALDEIRSTLPLDTSKKKTAAARRFYHDSNGELCARVEDALLRVMPSAGSYRVLSWMRFLEYLDPEGELPAHTDALVRCKETGQWSTHTLILYMSDCAQGGETVMLPWPCERKVNNTNAEFGVRPLRGRIFCFPHGCLHKGAPTVETPKILLRAELIMSECAGRQ